MFTAVSIFKNRKEFQELNKNPLTISKRKRFDNRKFESKKK